jgi:hypothetical protein
MEEVISKNTHTKCSVELLYTDSMNYEFLVPNRLIDPYSGCLDDRIVNEVTGLVRDGDLDLDFGECSGSSLRTSQRVYGEFILIKNNEIDTKLPVFDTKHLVKLPYSTHLKKYKKQK